MQEPGIEAVVLPWVPYHGNVETVPGALGRLLAGREDLDGNTTKSHDNAGTSMASSLSSWHITHLFPLHSMGGRGKRDARAVWSLEGWLASGIIQGAL
jgi:hypothetical protein